VTNPAANVIPDQVTVGVDARATSDESLDRLLAELRDVAAGPARQDGCGWDATLTWRQRDAAVLATAGVPVGMLFVRAGRAGVSHSPSEIVDAADIAVAVEALARALTSLA
jgi:acetylornithine deacetylase/succinyl-diaminopimelate desuccinylase-like protein